MATAGHLVKVEVEPPYEVHIEADVLSRAGQLIRALTASAKLCVVSDEHVAPLHLPHLRTSLEAAGFEVVACTLPAGEQHKTLESIRRIYDAFLPARIDRATPLVSLGGGVIGDMTGFAAATILRGVPFIQIPTTLLSMVDASVGGKTGIDHPCGKNLIGAFHQPRAVLVDPLVLQTLPKRELVGGLAECIKHDIIRDAAHFEALPGILTSALQLDMEALTQLLAHNVAIKARVVASDPFEKGERAHLNFGHTFGHAIETVSSYRYSHGESVSLGMVAAARAAQLLGMLSAADSQRIESVCRGAGLPTSGMTLDIDEVVAAMAFDKKVAGKRIRFVLPDRIGHVVIRDDVTAEVLRDAVASLR
jgi:3-dehydroquinate synthase